VEVSNRNHSPLDGIPLDLVVDQRHYMCKAEARIDNEGTLGGIGILNGKEGTIWNHGSGWAGMFYLSARDARYPWGMQLTCASVIRLKFVFLEHKLIVNILDVGQVEVRFCDDERGLWRVHLQRLQRKRSDGRKVLTERASVENKPSQTAFCASQSTR